MNRAGARLAISAAILGATVSVFARRAPWRRHPWYLAGMVGGLAGTELSVPMAVAQLATAGLAATMGAGHSRLGVLGLLASAASAMSLLHLQRVARDSTTVLRKALNEAFGPDSPRLPAPRLVSLPRPRRSACLVAENVPYCDQSPAQVLDVWRARGRRDEVAAPVVVQIHGGSWTGGSRRTQNLPLLGHLAANGWVCVAVDYRLGPDNRWPTAIVDIKRALAWVRATIHRYGGDPSFLAVLGGSAGGHLAALAALSGNDPALQPGFTEADTSVQAAVLLYGVYDLTALNDDGTPRLRDHLRRVLFDVDLHHDRPTWRSASPTWRLTAGAPPLLVVHGDRDEIVSVNQARHFVDRARRVSANPVGYAELPCAHHGYDTLWSTRTLATAHAVTRFLDTARRSA